MPTLAGLLYTPLLLSQMVVLFVVAKFVNEEQVFSVEDSWLMFVSIAFSLIKGADSFGIVDQN